VVFMGLGNACAVMVGNRIGAGRLQEAYTTVRNILFLCLATAWAIGLLVFLVFDAIAGLYELSPAGTQNVRWLLLIMGSTLWIRMLNFTIFIGALRAGGDTRFALLMEVFSIWLIGVPAAFVGGFVLKLPVYWIYLMVVTEEAVQAFICSWGFRSRKWIHDLVNPQ